MTTTKYLIFGICFLILAFFLLNFYDPKPPLLSITQHSELNTPYLFEGFVNGTLTVQEITLTKEYLNGVEIRLATMSRVNTNTNTILVLDSNYNVLHQEKFSSEVIEDSKYHAFQFKESMKAGKGNKIYICLFSKDGDSANCIHGLFNPSSKLGSLYASMLMNDDVIHSIRNKARLYPGTMILRTYESDSSFTSAIKWIWYLVVALLSVLIIFLKKFQRFLIRSTFRAEIVYFVIALIFGPLFVFLNPPFQVPDEGSHMSRIYELSELQFSKTGKTIPASIVKIDSTFLRLHFVPDEKTSKKEILSLTKIKLEPKVRRASNGPDYIYPYLPQVLGVVIGKIFTSTALALLYFGRFFNLLSAILIVFIAIRITPFSKWIFLLLALMPKTLYMMASLSYDAFVISNSFLLIALFLYYAFKAAKLNWRDIGLLFFLSLLLAFCKPPYFIIGFLFLIIPVRKIGSWVKYLLIFSVFVGSMLLAQGMWSLVGGLIKSPDVVKTERVAPVGQPAKVVSDVAPASPAPSPPKQEINPPRQVDYIRTHLPTFMTLLMVTNFDRMRVNMLNNFVGTMGWLDTFMPDTLINLYLILLLIAALCIAEKTVHVDWRRKTFFFILFISCVAAIETAMYVYSSFVGQERLFGIQGRYFIPLAPLFLLIFYNNFITEKLNYIFSSKRNAYIKAKPNQKPKILLEMQGEQLFTKYLQMFIILFTVVTLIRGIAAVLLRYYEW